MSSLPSEVLEDVLQPLDRWTLDGVQFTNRHFLQLILERMSEVCRRHIDNATFQAPSEHAEGSTHIRISGRPERRETWNADTDSADFFAAFTKALRSSHVTFLTTCGLMFTPALAALVLQTPIVATFVRLAEGSCAELTPTQFHKVVVHFSPTTLHIDTCQFLACQINDDFLRALAKSQVRRIKFPDTVPLDGGSFALTDDGIVDFCMQPDVPIAQGGRAPYELIFYNGSFTKDLFKRLVETNSVSMRTQPLRIVARPSLVEEEDLRDYAQQLSYCRGRGMPWQEHIYDFACEEHGPAGAMRLQIVLNSIVGLQMIRARRSARCFYDPDE